MYKEKLQTHKHSKELFRDVKYREWGDFIIVEKRETIEKVEEKKDRKKESREERE